MKIYNEIHANTDKWESGELGATQEFVKVSEFTAKDLQKSIELQPISLRINKDLLEDLKSLAKMHNIGYQPLMKQILKIFVDAEKRGLAEAREVQRRQGLFWLDYAKKIRRRIRRIKH